MRTTALLVLASLGLSSTAMAQRAYSTRNTKPVTLSAPVIDRAEVDARLARADSASSDGRPAEARAIYEQLVRDQREAGQFADRALWRLALNHLYADRKFQATQLLDELAQDANTFGDPATELRASFEAAVLWIQLKRPDLATSRIERSKSLLQSPVIADADKASIKSRMK